jgi:hypothetical protein
VRCFADALTDLCRQHGVMIWTAVPTVPIMATWVPADEAFHYETEYTVGGSVVVRRVLGDVGVASQSDLERRIAVQRPGENPVGKTRAEHIAWCEQRALEYLDQDDAASAIASMISDMNKHPETGIRPPLGVIGIVEATSGDIAKVRRWIEGFR